MRMLDPWKLSTEDALIRLSPALRHSLRRLIQVGMASGLTLPLYGERAAAKVKGSTS